MRFLKLIAAAAAAALVLSAWRSPSSEDQVRKVAENFVYGSLSLSPSFATSQGYHEDHGVALDEQLDDYSKPGIARARAFYVRSLADANRIPKTQLTPEFEADLDVIRLACEGQLFDIEKTQPYRHDPTMYVESIGNAVYSPFILNYAPESKRLSQITARIEKIPAFFETAKQNLVDSPEIWNQVAQEENEGNVDLIDRTIRAKIPPDLKARYDQAAKNALRALKSFNEFLKTDLIRRKSDWRLGPQLYAEKFKLTLATGDTPQQALVDAEAKLESIREDMRKQAIAAYPSFFPGKAPPKDLNTLVSQVLDKIAQQHATPDRYFEDAKRDLAETTQFVKDRKLLALPSGSNLQVIPTPEFMRGLGTISSGADLPRRGRKRYARDDGPAGMGRYDGNPSLERSSNNHRREARRCCARLDDQEAAIADLQKHGFNLISVAEPDLMASDPTRVSMRQLMGAVAQYDKSQIVAKLRGARMRKRAKEGRCEGRKPYGFYDGETATVARMKALRGEGLGFDRIAAQLNAEGIGTRTRGRWHGVMINRILGVQEARK